MKQKMTVNLGFWRTYATLFVLSALGWGCSTPTYRDFKTGDVGNNEGVAMGKVYVKYNDRGVNFDCSVCFKPSGKCQKLVPEGFVIQSLPLGEAQINRVECLDGSVQHHEITNVKFKVTRNPTYFGDLDIKWKNKGGYKATQMMGLIGAIVDESTNDGEIQTGLTIQSAQEVKNQYDLIAGSKASFEAKNQN